MQYGIIYSMSFKNVERKRLDDGFSPPPGGDVGVTVLVNIYDRALPILSSATPTTYTMIAADNAVIIETVDTSEDKFTPIKPLRAKIRFESQNGLTLDNFTDAPIPSTGIDPGDPRWYVEISISGKFLFKGFLSLDDCSVSFMSDPNVVELIATDGIGWLKNIPFVSNQSKLYKRQSDTIDGAWTSNTSDLFTATQLELHTTDMGANAIDWPALLQVNDQVKITLKDFPNTYAIYKITGTLPPGTNNLVFTVSIVTGVSYALTNDEQWYINKVGTETRNPNRYMRIADYLAQALQKTNLNIDLNAVFNIRYAIWVSTGSSTAQWIKIDYNSGSAHHYFIDMGAAGIFDITSQPSPPPYPGSENYSDLHFIAAGDADFALYLMNSGLYPNWVGGIQRPAGATLTVAGQLVPTSEGHLFDKGFLDQHTFEDKINTMISCYDVIAHILGEEGFITQRAGKWWILRVDEVENTIDYSIANLLCDGTYFSFTQDSSAYVKSISRDFSNIVLSNEATTYLQSSPNFWYRNTFRFQFPIELPCNSDFSRGAFISTMPDITDPVTGVKLARKQFNIDCWSYMQTIGIATSDTAYTVRTYDQNQAELDRYAELLVPSGNNNMLLSMEKVPMSAKDKFTLNLSVRWAGDIGGSKPRNVNIVWVRLYGDDGSFWQFGQVFPSAQSGAPYWTPQTNTWSNVIDALNFYLDSSIDCTQVQSMSWDIKPLPVSGQIEFAILDIGNPNKQAMDVNGLSIDYHPYLNGSYQLNSQRAVKSSRSVTLRPSRDQEVYMSDGLIKLAKGSIFKKNNTGGFDMVNQFFNWKATHDSPNASQVHPYQVIQNQDVWNQFRYSMKLFRINAQGLNTWKNSIDGENGMPSLIDTILLQDPHIATNNRKFLILSFSANLYTCEWSASVAEMINANNPKIYSDKLEILFS